MPDSDRPQEAGLLKLRLALEPESGTDAEEIERLGRRLRAQLRELDVDDVSAMADGVAPPGAKGADAAFLTEWLVTMSASGGVLAAVVATAKDWLARRAGGQTVELTIDGDTLKLGSARPDERADLIELFVRHQGA
jgi:hypothetical protein